MDRLMSMVSPSPALPQGKGAKLRRVPSPAPLLLDSGRGVGEWGNPKSAYQLLASHSRHHFPPGNWPSTPSTYQLTLSMALSSSLAPAATFMLPSCPLIGPVNTANFPALISAFLSATSFFAASGTMLLMLTRSFMPS